MGVLVDGEQGSLRCGFLPGIVISAWKSSRHASPCNACAQHVQDRQTMQQTISQTSWLVRIRFDSAVIFEAALFVHFAGYLAMTSAAADADDDATMQPEFVSLLSVRTLPKYPDRFVPILRRFRSPHCWAGCCWNEPPCMM
jgi:hypothetical protein